MMRVPRWAVALMVLGVAAGASGRRGLEREVVTLPEEAVAIFHFERLPVGGFGVPELVAGLSWLRVVERFGAWYAEHGFTPTRVRWLAESLEQIVRLEPMFHDPPLMAADGLAYHAGAVTAAHRTLLLALEGGWLDADLYFRLGFLYYWYYGDPVKAAWWWTMAAYLPGAPPYLANLAQLILLRRQGEVSTALAEILERRTLDPQLRGEWRKVRAFLEHQRGWQRDLERYHARFGRWPRTVTDLVAAGIWSSPPRDPWGGTIELSPDGRRVLPSERVPLFLKPSRYGYRPDPELERGLVRRRSPADSARM